MKNIAKLTLVALLGGVLASCGGNGTETTSDSNDAGAEVQSMVADDPMDDIMSIKGVGPITSVTIGNEIDVDMAARGEEVFKAMCTACHRTDKKFIGPNPTGVLDRRSPEWVMNMILNPEVMIQEDPIAKKLLMEFNGAPMANQNVSEEDARAILEFFRTLKQ